MKEIIYKSEKNRLHPLGEKIFLDRYSLKDMERTTFEVGDIVLIQTDTEKSNREVGHIKELFESNGVQWAKIIIGEDEFNKPISQVDKPLETPEEVMDRMAKGAASVESTEEERKFWKEEFRWALDGYKLVPAGRNWTTLGTDQELSAINCIVIESPHDSRSGIYDNIKLMCELHSRGSGVGINLSSLRPRFSYVKGVNGRSSGAVSWAEMYSKSTLITEQSGCLPTGTLIMTKNGMVPIENIVRQIKQMQNGVEPVQNSGISALTHNGYKNVSDAFDNGIKECFKIKTEYGQEIVATGNHPFITLSEEGEFLTKNLCDLSEGDYICNVLGDWPDDIALQHATKQFKGCPRKYNEDFAYFIGMYFANGYLFNRKNCESSDSGSRISIVVANDRPDTKSRLTKIIKKLFNYEPKIYSGDGKCETINIFSQNIVDFFESEKLLKKSSTTHFPQKILQSRKSVVLAFIGGYFDADGCNRGKKGGLGIDTISKQMAQEYSQVLWALGVANTIKVDHRENQENWSSIYRVSVVSSIPQNKFACMIKDYTSKIYDKQLSTRNAQFQFPFNHYYKYRKEIGVKINKVLANNGNSMSLKAIDLISQNINIISHDNVEQAKLLSGTIANKILSIEPVGDRQTWDITVDEEHLMSSSSFLTHNSRRGATMIILNDWHPDIEEFISSKKDMSRLNGCNISVGISDRFMDAVKSDEEWELIFPDTSDPKYDEEWDGSIDKWAANGHSFIVHKVIRARELWRQITEAAWESAEPGLWFKDRANYWSAAKYYDELICTNPCGEQGLGAFSVCNLLHINLSTIVKNGKIDYDLLKRLTEDAVRFGDNVIDAGKYHEPRVEKKQKAERRIGIGTLGLAEMLIKLRVRYGSQESLSIIYDVYSTIKNTAYKTSALIADAKGVFYNYSRDVIGTPFIKSLGEDAWLAINAHGLRNCDLLTSAPCGTISTMVNTSGGIEPYFALEWERQSRVGRFKEGCRPYFEWKEKNEMYCRDHVGNALPDYFVTAMELSPKEHVDVMAACQKHISNSQSKTVNCPEDWTVDQVAELYMYMYDAGCKGGTIYRDKSRDEQVLHLIEEKEKEEEGEENNLEKSDAEQLMHETAEIIEKSNYCYERIIGPIRDGRTISIGSPAGTCHINLNVDYNDEPCEMYVSIGKAGSDVLAFTEALARIVSYALTLESPVMPTERLNAIIDQLSGIGGSISYGFGQKKVSSVPDAIAKGLKMLQEENVDVTQEEIDFIMGNDDSFYDLPPMTSVGDLCPSCGALSLVRGAGCSSCQECGYSAC